MKNKFSKSELPIRRSAEFLPKIFQTDANDKFLSATLDPYIQPGSLEKVVGYVGRRYGKTFQGNDIYVDTDNTLRSRYQLEPGVVFKKNQKVADFYDYIDFKNILKFFGNENERDDVVTSQDHYSWNPPIDWDKFINYREYYWLPQGPEPISVSGQQQGITSTYGVKVGPAETFIFTPDGLTNNPTITLFRGQTYKFQINAPGDGFFVRLNYDTGSLLYDPFTAYPSGQYVIFDNSLWRSKRAIGANDGSSIDKDSQDWEYIEPSTVTSVLDFGTGITNNGTDNGTITFEVPFNSPEVLYYQSLTDPDKFGKFIIADIQSNTKIDIEKEIIGKVEYTSSNNIAFSNGMLVNFTGNVSPRKYASSNWLVEGVGDAISLTELNSLVVPRISSEVPEILFDNEGFDSQPFDDASSYPGSKDYITISKSSKDLNPWSRYNRWFHRSVLEKTQTFAADEQLRAKRPIIEFLPNIKLHNHGTRAKSTVDFVDNFTTDIFSTVEGSTGYIIDGEELFQGARVLVVAETDSLANNRIYSVNFIIHNGRRQIAMVPATDSESLLGEAVLVRRGKINRDKMFWFNGDRWIQSQEKTSVNQSPQFDVFDSDGISFSDTGKYLVNNFVGSKIVSYKLGSSGVDRELGFPLSYLNINNVGDIQFTFDWDIDTFIYEANGTPTEVKISSGFTKRVDINEVYENCWTDLNKTYVSPILDYVTISQSTNQIDLRTVNWQDFDSIEGRQLEFYLNTIRLTSAYTRVASTFIFDTRFEKGDVLTVKIFADIAPDQGYYEIPVGLEKNPLNQKLTAFTLGQATDHIATAIEFDQSHQGTFPGNTNLRDLNISYRNFGKRFIKHSELMPVSLSLLVDKQMNVIKSLRYAKKYYSEFKYNFLKLAGELPYDQNPVDMVDDILKELTKAKNTNNSFSYSDMVGTGAFTEIDYLVEDTGITVFSLSEKFSLNDPSDRAVYVYINNEQLLADIDYQFNETFGFVTIIKPFNDGDLIQIREYVSTEFCFIPPTPTKLGLYKKYTPSKYLDDTYQTPREMIQGHDGSRIAVYGDYRDDILLELEKRIYNNIKIQYDETEFDNDKIVGGYYKNATYDKTDYQKILDREYLIWVSDTNVDYVNNIYFDSENSWTYIYSRMSDPKQEQNLPGWWRGVYQWFYDTDRPHSHPWEMLGFSEKPNWWEDEYGPAPYTSNNLILWEDLQEGAIKQGARAGVKSRYARPGIINHLPVDGNGKLLSPLDSNLANNFALINSQGNFKLGDISPAEHVWYTGSEYPYASIISLCLLKPFEYICYALSKSVTTKNILGQRISQLTNEFLVLNDIVNQPRLNLYYIIGEYLKSQNNSPDSIKEKLESIDVQLSHRLSGFVDDEQQKFLLDSKSPQSASSSVFIPVENQQIVFNKSAPIDSITYSAVILEKVNAGWKVSGYDNFDPKFYYYQAIAGQGDPLLSVGGVSEAFVEWTVGKFYNNGKIVRFQSQFYRAISSHTADASFDAAKWKKLPALPNTGAIQAYRRKNFKLRVSELPYGTILNSIQSVVDFFVGYEQYLVSKGFIFDQYAAELQSPLDWTTSAKEYMFWTQHNWANGSLLTVSPLAEKLEISFDIGVPDSILDSFYDYQLYKSDGQPLTTEFVNFKREYQKFTAETVDTNDGIYFLKIYQVLKEHVVIFDDRTVFNDVIYDKPTGYRQERIKVRGFRTVDWDGDYTSPGFVYDVVNINNWQQFVDYKLGDIVSYKGINYTSKENQPAEEFFQVDKWSILDVIPRKGLVPNIDYRINQFDDFYNLDADGLQSSQRMLGRHAIGYQSRSYLQNLSEDDVTQFRLYQGFIRDKGTQSAVVKVFDKLSKVSDDSIVLKEEWAIKVGTLGGTEQYSEIEFKIEKKLLELDPQPVLVVTGNLNEEFLDQYVRLSENEFTTSLKNFNPNLFETTEYKKLRTAGYVKLDQVNFVISNIDKIVDLDITTVKENDHIYVTFYNTSWTVFRIATNPVLTILNANKAGNLVTLDVSRQPTFAVGDYIGINEIVNLTGFFKVADIQIKKDAFFEYQVSIEVPRSNKDPELDSSTFTTIMELKDSRYEIISALEEQKIALLPQKSKLWIDSNNTNSWEVLEKNKVYNPKKLIDYGTTAPLRTGQAVAYSEILRQTFTSVPTQNLVSVLVEGPTGLQIKQTIVPELVYADKLVGSFGKVLALSPDSKWLVVGSPEASGIPSDFVGEYLPTRNYVIGDIVLENGRLFRSLANVNRSGEDGSTLTFATEDWEIVNNISVDAQGNGTGYRNQGAVLIYFWNGQLWNLRKILVSPRPAIGEHFGQGITIAGSGTSYWLAVGAPGSQDNRGRVYLFNWDGTDWTFYENPNYMGAYDKDAYYPLNAIVWYDGDFYKAVEDSTGGTAEFMPSAWTKIDPVSTQSSLPTNVALADDGSTLASGLLDPADMSELTKSGDQFGKTVAFNKDATILVIGVPDSDGQYFSNFKGEWDSFQEYREGNVVRRGADGSYYQLTDTELVDSTYRSYNQDPNDGLPWVRTFAAGSDNILSGKVYIYQRDDNNIYKLAQVLNAATLADFNDTVDSALSIDSGDKFGFAVDIDAIGQTIVIGSPLADTSNQDQGAVYIFSAISLDAPQWRLKQKLQAFEDYSNILFGSSVAISPNSSKVVVGAQNAPTVKITYFEQGTTFDRNRTGFSESQGYTGQVYIFERISGKYILAEKLQDDLQVGESFGYSLKVGSSVVVVGSPTYKINDQLVGLVRTFRKDDFVKSLKVLASEQPLIDVSKIRNIKLIDPVKQQLVTDIETIDAVKGKILGTADQEISYKVPYDPAIYTQGTGDQVVDESQAWFEKNVGKIWWNLATAKWYYYEQGDLNYRLSSWNQLAAGAAIDIYEWVETALLPSEWSAVADTVDGLANGISGQPLYPNDDVYSQKIRFNPLTQQPTETRYYYWITASTVVPSNLPNRHISAAEVAQLISRPESSGRVLMSAIDSDKFIIHNLKSAINGETALINIEFVKDSEDQINVHREYQLISESIADSVPSESVEQKWIDSLIGFDAYGNPIPDPQLSENKKYGILYRPRQSMFKNRLKILQLVLEKVNVMLQQQPFADTLNFDNLNSVDAIPSPELREYDKALDTQTDLEQLQQLLGGFFDSKVRQAKFSSNIINGEVDTIDIIDPGFGYLTVPFVEIVGRGKGARAEITLDSQGRVNSIKILTRGKKYDSAIVQIRPFTVLVGNDTSAGGFWGLFGWDSIRGSFYRRKMQGFDTTKYWEYVDWWKEGYNTDSKTVKEIINLYQEATTNLKLGELLRVKEYTSGGWAVFQRIDNGEILGKYTLVGRQSGTIKFLERLYNDQKFSLGFDAVNYYDTGNYDPSPVKELRNIFRAIKEDIFIGDLRVEWNNLFFSCIRYVLHEQSYVDWIFKTSFVNAIHNVGPLAQKTSFRSDSLESYQEYLNEVKPYRTTIREYTSRYTTLDDTNTNFTDFDLPPTYSVADGKIVPVTVNSFDSDREPWINWKNNIGYSVVAAEVSDPGEKYNRVPTVLIEGNGSGAKAVAYIRNGKVTGIQITSGGQGYTKTPTITLIGGNGSTPRIAKASAILGSGKARTVNVAMKFDRVTKVGLFLDFDFEQTFVAVGNTAVFDLTYAPNIDKSKIRLFKNSQLVLSNEYSITAYNQKIDGYTVLRGRLILANTPDLGDEIVITYEKNDQILDAVNRINKFYAPTSGMSGNDVSQLMTGIDFGGVEIQGTTFDITGGWDALPWFTDGWDTVESNSDFYIVADGSTGNITLPYTPADNQKISIYVKRHNENRTIRIDSEYWLEFILVTNEIIPIWSPLTNYLIGNVVRHKTKNSNNFYIAIAPSSGREPLENAIMPTIIGDGNASSFDVHDYISFVAGDTIILRPFNSDGSLSINDVNLIDTNVSGGTFSKNLEGIAGTATGLTADEIVLEGGKFTSPQLVSSPEENVPGQVLDSLSIKVFQSTVSGASPMQSYYLKSDGATKKYPLGVEIITPSNVLIYVNKQQLEYSADSSVDYTIDFSTNEVILNQAPSIGADIEIISLGAGGQPLIDYAEFLADGETSLFLTKAQYTSTSSVLVTVDGVETFAGVIDSSTVIAQFQAEITPNKSMIQFAIPPGDGQQIKIISFGLSDITTLPYIRLNRQAIMLTGTVSTVSIDNFNNFDRGSAEASVIVELNGIKLKGPDTYYVIYDGSNNTILVGVDPDNIVTSVDIRVYINNILQPFVTAYVYDGTTGRIIVNNDFLNIQDVIKVEVATVSEYTITGNQLTLDPLIITNNNDRLDITWFDEYPTLDVISDIYAAGKVNYRLKRNPLSASYLFVYLNGRRQQIGKEYRVDAQQALVYLNVESTPTDRLEILEFGNQIFKLPRSFQIFKDMLNLTYYNRVSITKVSLAKELTYYDTSIEVTDSSKLDEPNSSRNIPGTVEINKEKIQYLSKQGNVLSQIRRGVFGTAIPSVSPAGTKVINVGQTEVLPYSDTQERSDFLSDGSSLLIGPLEFVPKLSQKNNWTRETIPADHGPCDTVEIFVGGRRLRKDPIAVWDEAQGQISPNADKILEAEFSVNGVSPYIRLTVSVSAGTRILIVRKIGTLWYQRSETTASEGITLLNNNTSVARFIDQRVTELPE